MNADRKYSGAAVLLSAFLMASTGKAQDRADFKYKLKESRISAAGWKLGYQRGMYDTTWYHISKNSNSIYALLGAAGEKILVDVWPFEDGKVLGGDTLDAATPVNYKDSAMYLFHPRRTTLNDQIVPICLGYQGWVFGGSAIAARVRFAVDGRDELGVGNIGLAGYGGYTWGEAIISPRRITHVGVVVGPFFGASTTDLKQNVYKDPDAWVADRTALTLCYGGNVVIYRNKIGLVVSYGYETPLGPNGKQWVYNWNPWLGVGLATGLGIF